MRAPTVYGGATDGCKCISQLQFPSPKTSLLEGGGPSADGGRSRRWKQFFPIVFMPNILLLSDAQSAYEAQEAYEAHEE